MALRRFISRRGKPLNIYSDNTTNFVGADAELKELANFLVKSESNILSALAEINIKWKFIWPHCPHMASFSEARVKTIRHHLKRVAGNAALTYEELN